MDLDSLARIKRVEAPPYLFTRIQQKIEQSKRNTVPVKITWAINLAFGLVLILNIIVLTSYNSKSSSTEDYAQSIHLISDNSLYE